MGLILFSEPPLAFIHIPKSAGTSIGTALARAGKVNGWVPKAHDLHPTAKPMDLWGVFVRYHSQPDDLVYEPFGGSGTTPVVCQQLGRRCFTIEIEPQYCDVIVARLRAQGLEAVRWEN